MLIIGALIALFFWAGRRLFPDSKFFKKDEREPVAPADVFYINLDDHVNQMAPVGVLSLKGSITKEMLGKQLSATMWKKRMVPSPPNSDQPQPGWFPPKRYWEDCPDFSPEDQIEEITDTVFESEEELLLRVNDLVLIPIDKSRPLWKAYIAHCKNGTDAVLFRVHHGIGDGVSLIRGLIAFTESSGQEHGAVRHRAAKVNPAILHRVWGAFKLAAQTLYECVVLLTMSYQTACCLVPPRSVPIADRFSGKKKTACSPLVPIEKIKSIRQKASASFNDVVMAAMAGAFRKYILKREPEKFDSGNPGRLENLIGLLAADMRGPNVAIEKMGNLIALIMYPLNVGGETLKARIAAMKAFGDRLKASTAMLIASRIMMTILGLLPGPLQRYFNNDFGAKAAGVVTNIPGPASQVSMCGVPVDKFIVFPATAGGSGFAAGVVSYAGAVCMTLQVDVAICDDPAEITQLWVEELEAMELELERSRNACYYRKQSF